MLSNDLRPEAIEISLSLLVAFTSARAKYEEAKRTMKKDKEKSEEENLINQLDSQINQLKSKVADIDKTLNFLDEKFTERVFSAEISHQLSSPS